MTKIIVALTAAFVLTACDGGNPFVPEEESGGGSGSGTGTGTPIDGDRVVPPGTASPSPDVSLFRSEPTSADGGNEGDGFAQSVAYDSATDTFRVDNLGFDGDNVYARGTNVGSLGPYAVYEAAAQYPDSFTSRQINQFTHRAIYGVSTSGNTKFAIVRTGAYVGYGFGGFIYQRENNVTLPSTGQALYSGVMAGMRDFKGAGGLEYTTADISIAIDFEDFNPTTGTRGDAVQGFISNRTIYDVNGNDVTGTVVSRIENEHSITLGRIPNATFTVGPGVLDDNGEMLGSVQSYYADSSGNVQTFEEGNFYAIVSGDDAEEIVGIVVLESTLDPVAESARDTSGFIIYR